MRPVPGEHRSQLPDRCQSPVVAAALELGEEGLGVTLDVGVHGRGVEPGGNLQLGDAAERLALEGEALGGPEDLFNYTCGQRIRALVALERGDFGEAEELARSALDFGYRIDFPRYRGEAHVALGDVLRAAGRIDEARTEYTAALELWDGLGWTGKAEPVRQLLVQL